MLAAERKVTSKLLEQDTSAEKLYILNEYVVLELSDCFPSVSPTKSIASHHTAKEPRLTTRKKTAT